MLNKDTIRGRYIDGLHFQTGAQGEELDAAGEEFDEWFKSIQVEAWERAKTEIRHIPCWYQDKENHGFDLGTDDEGNAVEAGARRLVMEILDHNPYRDGERIRERKRRAGGRRRRPGSESD